MATRSWQERFWAKVDRRGPDECWPWTGARVKNGYGTFNLGDRAEGAHRIAYRLSRGAYDPSLNVRHLVCDNPPCCNPAHLAPGTQQANVQDMLAKGRGLKRLTAAVVLDIRRRHAQGEVQRRIALDVGVSPAQVHRVVHRTCWAHI